ncbi:MAG TPA: cysteine rich repeat-containing protein [Kiloniellaceae bacterium]
MMKSAPVACTAFVAWCFLALCLWSGTAAAQDPVQDALKGCESELQTYCSEVTPGDGRLVSCAEAYEDKLSSQCIAAINRAGYWLTYLATTIDYIARQCEADAAKHCPDVELGEQRVLNCLASHRKQLDEYCSLALSDIGK